MPGHAFPGSYISGPGRAMTLRQAMPGPLWKQAEGVAFSARVLGGDGINIQLFWTGLVSFLIFLGLTKREHDGPATHGVMRMIMHGISVLCYITVMDPSKPLRNSLET